MRAADALGPPLKWAGGKRWLVPHLEPLWAGARSPRLVEPFCGGLAVALGLGPQAALLNDVNPHAINFYRHVQRGLRMTIPMRNEKELYYAHRAEFNRLVTGRGARTRKAAELFYFLNKTGFNGLCRFNKSGEFNVPFGKFSKISYRRDLRAYAVVFEGWEFTDRDFAEIALERDDFVYADPPYDTQFHHYSKGGFDWSQQVRLAEWLVEHGGPVVLSNQATERVLDLYRALGFELRLLEGPRYISRTGDRTPALEVLATRNL